ncbi:MAG: TIGR03619 family F420-dependent LLM class oxidoreductase [Gammaproteobacteria bacterium]
MPPLAAPAVGIFPACTDRSMPILDLAREAEARGFAGIYLNEHTHMPVDHGSSRFPAGGPTPERYGRFWDPYIALTWVAAQTRLEVGTSISLIGEHDPIALAKAIATLDTLSQGRFAFGVGWGWNREEFEDHGHPANRRAQVVEECIVLMKKLWTQEVAAHRGEYFSLRPSHAWPKPCQKPHPPVFMGIPGNARNYERIARYAEGWLPWGFDFYAPEFGTMIQDLRHAFEAAGRDPETLRIRATINATDTGSLRESIERGARFGLEALYLYMADDPRDDALRILDWAARAFT